MIKLTNEIEKELIKDDFKYYDKERFIKDCKRYIKAIKENRMICCNYQVSKSGASRSFLFTSCEKVKNPDKTTNYFYANYSLMFQLLGYRKIENTNDFRVYGSGTDMIFYTNYTIIHSLHKMGFLNKSECNILSQKTPDIL